jgi:hypothetical protein
MLRQELAFIKAITALQLSIALLREPRKALYRKKEACGASGSCSYDVKGLDKKEGSTLSLKRLRSEHLSYAK